MKIIKITTNTILKVFLILFVFSTMNMMGQRQKTSLEFSLHTGGGFDAYAFGPSKKANSSSGYGAEVGAGFSGFFSPTFGIYVGVGLNFVNIKSKLDTLKYVTSGLIVVDGEGNPRKYDLHTLLRGYTEAQTSMFITIPVMLQYQTKLTEHWHYKQRKNVAFYAMGGFKIHFLVNNKYEVMVPTLHNAGYFTDMGVWITGPTSQGFGTFHNSNVSNGKLNFGVMGSLALEAGAKWRVDRKIFLYTGVYFDCGLNDPFRSSRETLADYTSVNKLKNLPLLKVADRINLLAVGIKVRVAFHRVQ